MWISEDVVTDASDPGRKSALIRGDEKNICTFQRPSSEELTLGIYYSSVRYANALRRPRTSSSTSSNSTADEMNDDPWHYHNRRAITWLPSFQYDLCSLLLNKKKEFNPQQNKVSLALIHFGWGNVIILFMLCMRLFQNGELTANCKVLKRIFQHGDIYSTF